jgi:hypothetical protein
MRGMAKDEQQPGRAAPSAAPVTNGRDAAPRLQRVSTRRASRPESWVSRDGFQVVARDDEGMGYIVLERFDAGPRVRATALAAMRYLSGTTSLLVDLRCTRPGDAATAAFLTSLLFDTEPLTGEEVFAPAPALPAAGAQARYLARHVMILVSRATSADALTFACNLAHLGRALVRMADAPERARCA